MIMGGPVVYKYPDGVVRDSVYYREHPEQKFARPQNSDPVYTLSQLIELMIARLSARHPSISNVAGVMVSLPKTVGASLRSAVGSYLSGYFSHKDGLTNSPSNKVVTNDEVLEVKVMAP